MGAHTPAQFTNAWLVGLLIAAFAGLAVVSPKARSVNTGLSIWLFFSVWLLPTSSLATAWNHVVVAMVVVVLSVIGPLRERRLTVVSTTDTRVRSRRPRGVDRQPRI